MKFLTWWPVSFVVAIVFELATHGFSHFPSVIPIAIIVSLPFAFVYSRIFTGSWTGR